MPSRFIGRPAPGIKAAAAAVVELLSVGADERAMDNFGVTPLCLALWLPDPDAAAEMAALLTVGPVDAVLEDLCCAGTTASRRLLTKYIANNLPLTDDQWARVPIPCPGLSHALPTALACSVGQARQQRGFTSLAN